MKLSTLEDREVRDLAGWLELAQASEQPVALHVVGQGWELRCEGLKPFFFYPDRGIA